MTIRARCGVVDEAVETGEELDRVLDGIERGAEVPVLVALSGPDSVLHVGLGAGEASVARFLDSDRRPLAPHCLGDDAVEAPTFAKDGREYEFEPSAVFASAEARRAAHQHLASGERPQSIVRRREPVP